MRYFTLSLLACATLSGFALDAAAQETETAAPPSEPAAETPEPVSPEPEAPATVEPPPSVTSEVKVVPAVSYDELRLEELKEKSRRSRNALIGTSAAAVVGLPLWIAGARTQCVRFIDSTGTEQLSCSTGGKVMLGFGIPLAMGGLTGALISGIMLGVRNGKIRDLNRRIGYEKSRALRWDPASAQFVF